MDNLSTVDIHARIVWPAVLERLGVDAAYLRDRHGPCPACGGKDRFRFDNRRARGDFFCNGCGAGDGFDLLMRVKGWDFAKTVAEVIKEAGFDADNKAPRRDQAKRAIAPRPAVVTKASPTFRVRSIMRSVCAVSDIEEAIAYLESRLLWPLPDGCTLRAHVGIDYFREGQRIGRYAALVAPITDIDGELVSAHVTYLLNGRKLQAQEPRKILSPMTGRVGCAVRLAPPVGGTLGIAEGLETAAAATIMMAVPTWAALNTSMLAKFEPPTDIKRLVIFADRDAPGQTAAASLMMKLQGRVQCELRTPAAPAKDWNDALRG